MFKTAKMNKYKQIFLLLFWFNNPITTYPRDTTTIKNPYPTWDIAKIAQHIWLTVQCLQS